MVTSKKTITINPAEANALGVKMYSDSTPPHERITAAWEYGKICGYLSAVEELLAKSTGKTNEITLPLSE